MCTIRLQLRLYMSKSRTVAMIYVSPLVVKDDIYDRLT